MIGLFDAFARPLLLSLDPEQAHRATIIALKSTPVSPLRIQDPRLGQTCFGLNFPNPIGMAAGFDKNGEAIDGLRSLGFGFCEIGTITPRPQTGNAKPRLFRLTTDRGVVNRLGFNNEGYDVVCRRLRARARKGGVVGVNLGANKDSSDRIADYVAGVKIFSPLASYLTINISSPNTPGLRDLQHSEALRRLLSAVLEARDYCEKKPPILVKIAPDLALNELDDVVRTTRALKIDGMIVSNTTISRPSTLGSKHSAETGGLSGRPLFELSTRMLRETYARVEGDFPLVGVGGIDSLEAAIAKFEAGAALIQIYSGLVYEGVGLVQRIAKGLAARLDAEKLDHVSQLIGRSSSG